MRIKPIAYWVTTGLLVLGMVGGAIGELMRWPDTIKGMELLGYPVYLITIIGVWKLLGGIVLLVPRLPRAKEWAYAGFFFNMTGAAISHAVMNDYGVYAFHIVVTLAFAGLVVASWALRPPSRTLGMLFPGKARA